MNYAQGAALGGASNLTSQQQAGISVPTPRTIASAIGRVEGLNDRLVKVREQLAGISDAIGGPRNIVDGGKSAPTPPSNNAVSRLNDSADCAHDYLTEIEGLLASTSRALG